MPLSFSLGKETYTLSDECLERMRLAMENTVTRERGFALLGDIKDLMPGKEKFGGRERIRIPDVEGVKGFFHTHPAGFVDIRKVEGVWQQVIVEGDPEDAGLRGWFELSAGDAAQAIEACAKLQVPYLMCSGHSGDVQCTTLDDIDKLAIPKTISDDLMDELTQHLVEYHFRVDRDGGTITVTGQGRYPVRRGL